MLTTNLKWVRSYSRKMCPNLRSVLIANLRPQRWIPCFLQSLLDRWKARFTRIGVIVEKAQDSHFAELAGVRAAMAKHNSTISHELPLINSFASRMTIRGIAELAEHPAVKKIWLDREVHTVLDIAGPVVQAPGVWDWGFTGEDITVAIIDTGVYNHPDLVSPTNRIVAFRDFIKNKTVAYDDNGHGTHVAGCVAGNGTSSQERYKGLAPRANVVGLKVLDRNGSGLLSTVIAGIQWCIEEKERLGIRVINLSLGSSAQGSYRDDPVCQAVEKAWQAGIVVVAAAGNEGPEAGTIGSPGNDALIITVGASDDRGTVDQPDDVIADFSSRGPTGDGLEKPDVIAPGTNIISLAAQGSTLYRQLKSQRVDKNYLSLSGTSMATPICAGIIALILQANPGLSPDEVKTLLKGNARSLDFAPNSQGAGYVDAFACIKAISLGKGQQPDEPGAVD
ncbi:MAG TPA: S8 family peptidase [Bacillota bacterium]|nr:S8 family peptidase [Bacillota bacterium]